LKKQDAVIPLESRNTFIGLSEELVKECSMQTVSFEPGDRLILYTDGISETETPKGEMLDVVGLQDLVSRHTHLSISDQIGTVIQGVEEFRGGGEPQDDQLLLGVSFSEDD